MRDPNRGKLVGFGESSPFGLGSIPFAVLSQTGDGVTGEQLVFGDTVDAEVYELSVVATDTTVNTADDELNNTNGFAVVTITAHGLSVGDLIRVEDEIMKIIEVIDVNTVRVSREHSGTTIAAHADGEDILKAAAAATAGAKEVGLGADVTNASVTTALAAVIDAETNIGLNAEKIADDELLVALSAGAQNALAVSTDFSNGTWLTGANMVAGVNPNDSVGPMVVQSRVPLANEVAAAKMHFVLPFAPVYVGVLVTVTATGVQKVWDGLITIVGNRVTLDDGAATEPFAATDTIRLVALQ